MFVSSRQAQSNVVVVVVVVVNAAGGHKEHQEILSPETPAAAKVERRGPLQCSVTCTRVESIGWLRETIDLNKIRVYCDSL